MAAAAVIGVYLMLPSPLQPWAFDGLSLGAGVAMILVIRLRRFPRPLPWLLIAGPQLAFGMGDFVYDFPRIPAHQSPFPSAADGFYGTGYGMLVAGLILLVRRRFP